MSGGAKDDLGPWVHVRAHYRNQTGGAIGFWVGDMHELKEDWVWIPNAFIRRSNPAPRGQIETLEIREKWVIDKGLEGCGVAEGAAAREAEQGDLF